ncbi:ABC transporter permease [Microbacterium sp. cx-59]|uniref:ABC transporter permease n=1 Tax=Microbacterium sp. cx-59 TaxID=2891207 RepID=UPI001E2DB440|nr:ABC transporter permease [Microbacterium sp. cx-59]MCC4909207.1 ABC transporter permease [Microbacterium sp. cx-59]
MKRLLTGFVGAVLEAWQELRVHRTRVLLSLVGVAVAVCSLTTVVALGGIVQQATAEMNERSSGRPATLYLAAYRTDSGTVDSAKMAAAWDEMLARYDITYASRVMQATQTVPFATGSATVGVQAVDQPYGEMHRVRMSQGEWFTPSDAEQYAPRLIVNDVFYDRMGRPDLATHPTVALGGDSVPGSATGATSGILAVVVGVTPVNEWETEPTMFMLADQLQAVQQTVAQTQGAPDPSMDPYGGAQTQYEMWVPPEVSQELGERVKADMQAALGEGTAVDVSRQDYAQYDDDPFLVTKLVVGGIAVLVLLLGALGLVNIALVTVRQRVREIGIRRSFGATAGRVFFAVMMESVVATVAAGALGVAAAILIVQSSWMRDLIGQGMITDFPPFPVDAAILGLIAASAVGALAGLLPAIVAVRVKVIDAIRY